MGCPFFCPPRQLVSAGRDTPAAILGKAEKVTRIPNRGYHRRGVLIFCYVVPYHLVDELLNFLADADHSSS
jgi:hypothetical protein